MLRIDTLHYARAAAFTVFVMVLPACGDSSSDVDAQKVAVTDSKAQTVELPLNPINLATAYAPLTGQAPSIPVCPWLSDASAAAAVDVVMTDKPMVRRSVTSSQCKWNVNLGFTLTIRSTPLVDAVSPSSIKYNMDVPPVLAPQDGPGSDAVAILDPTWDAKNPRPFAFAFNADNRQFKITTTGVKTSIDRLSAVADEIAAALPTATAVVEAKDAVPTLDPCVYQQATVVSLFNGQAADVLTQEPYLPGSSCSYKGSVSNRHVSFTVRFSADPLDPPNGMDPEYVLIDGFGADVYMKDTSQTAGTRTRRVYQIARPAGNIRVDLTMSEERFSEDAVIMILKNLIARTQ